MTPAALDEYAQEQQHGMCRLAHTHGSAEDPVCPGSSIPDRARRLMQGLCRLDQQYTLYQTRVLQEIVPKLAEWVETNPDELEWW